MYSEDDLLMLSGIQHYAFCRRQWGLIHIEQAWHDNYLTIEGSWMHRHVDNPRRSESNRTKPHLNAVHLVSYELGLYGVADILELSRAVDSTNAITLPKKDGYWTICPVEYKHGRPKENDEDALQLCAQAMCLEEMHRIQIKAGAIYYGETRHREDIIFDSSLRESVRVLSKEMHALMAQGMVPQGKYTSKCRACSLADICMAGDERLSKDVNDYLQQLEE